MKEFEKLPEGATVNPNQYNVHAYKKVVHGYNIFPGYDAGRIKINEITADTNRRVSTDGKYIGVIAGYDFEHDKAKIGLRYSY